MDAADAKSNGSVTAEGKAGGKRWPWGRILRPLLSMGLLYWLLKDTRWHDFLNIAGRADLTFLGMALALVVAAVVLSAYKWQRLLSAEKVKAALPRLFAFYLVGLFFNNFLPTNIGGDVVRVRDTARYIGKPAESVASVVTERLLAALALALTAVVGLLLSVHLIPGLAAVVLGLLTFSALVVVVLSVEKWRLALDKLIRPPERFKLRQRLSSLSASMSLCLRDWKNTVLVILLSMLFQVMVVAVTYFIFLSLGLKVPFVYCLLSIPIISAVQTLPVSISGFGVREGAYVFFFSGFGVSTTEAVAASLIFWILVAGVSLPGGMIFALRRQT